MWMSASTYCTHQPQHHHFITIVTQQQPWDFSRSFLSFFSPSCSLLRLQRPLHSLEEPATDAPQATLKPFAIQSSTKNTSVTGGCQRKTPNIPCRDMSDLDIELAPDLPSLSCCLLRSPQFAIASAPMPRTIRDLCPLSMV